MEPDDNLDVVAAFPRRSEYERAVQLLSRLALPFAAIAPFRHHAPALRTTREGAAALQRDKAIACSGCVDYRPRQIPAAPDWPCFAFDIFGEAAIMLLAPCMADENKVRLIVHLSGDLTAVLPLLNAEMRSACYNPEGGFLTFMDEYRLITLYARRVAMGKADDLADAWRTIEKIRFLVNHAWSRRAEITPCYEARQKPAVLDIYRRLPRTDCRACGEGTCMAFAASLWLGRQTPLKCAPVFSGDYRHLRSGLLEVCAFLGLTGSD